MLDLLQLVMMNNTSNSIDYRIFKKVVLDYLLTDEIQSRLVEVEKAKRMGS